MRRFFSREFLGVFIPALAIAVAAFWFAFKYVKPAPPTSFAIDTASKGSPYYELALRYRDFIAKNGVDAEVRESQGSFDNLKGLKDDGANVDAGIIQGGITSRFDSPNLLSMGRLLTEPVWVFYRGDEHLDRLTQLKGKRVLVGPDGGGTNFLAKKLLDANGITAENTTLISMQLPAYIDEFLAGRVDAGFLVLGAEAMTVQKLLRTPGVRLMNMSQADGLIQRYPFLNRIVLRQGVIDFGKNIPPEDTSLVATRAALIVRDDLHPTLIALLAQAVLAVQSQPTLTNAGEARLFSLPSDSLANDDPEFPLAPEARRVYKNGPTFLQRLLPFWLATLLDRLIVLILPLLGIILPLIRIVPFIYNWRMRRRILHWYKQLKMLESDLPKAAPAELIAEKEKALDRIEEGVYKISMPIQYSADLYNLRDHVEFVRRRVSLIKNSGAAAGVLQPALVG